MMSRMNIIALIAVLAIPSIVLGQMPKNDDKEFEYRGEGDVRRAGTGDLVKRFEHWGNDYFANAASLTVLVDDSTERFLEIEAKENLVEMYFGVNRVHKERHISFHITFDTDRKDYTYVINDFRYEALEIDHKGREERHNGRLSEIKTAASKSLEEEIHERITSMIESFEKAAEIELEE